MKIIVTGGYGFIGSNLIKSLLTNKNYQVFGGMTLNIYILYGIIYNIKIYCKLNIIFIKVRQLKLPKEQFCDETQYLYYITRTQNRIGQTINTNR